MNDLFALAVFFAALALVIALSSGDLLAWFREEWRLLRLHTWAPDVAPPCTLRDERALRIAIKRDAAVQKMRRHGIKTLLEGRKAWQTIKPMHDEEPPARVVSINRKSKGKF